MRVFSDCAASGIEALNRLERDDGRLVLCVQREDPSAPERDVVLAVSNYHETHFTYDLALTHATDTSTVCEPWEAMRVP